MPNQETDAIRETEETEGLIIMPFYLIVDNSGSMVRDVKALNEAITDLIAAIRKDPIVDDLVMLSIIAFNSSPTTIAEIQNPSELSPPDIKAGGGTNYGLAFRHYKSQFERDVAELKRKGYKVYRPCVFFLTDGAPNDGGYHSTFRELFEYDPETKAGNRQYPYFVPFGFREAPEEVLRKLAYPNFGSNKGRWFLSHSSNVGDALSAMATAIGNTVMSSGQSAESGAPQHVAPEPTPDMNATSGEADKDDWM